MVVVIPGPKSFTEGVCCGASTISSFLKPDNGYVEVVFEDTGELWKLETAEAYDMIAVQRGSERFESKWEILEVLCKCCIPPLNGSIAGINARLRDAVKYLHHLMFEAGGEAFIKDRFPNCCNDPVFCPRSATHSLNFVAASVYLEV